MRGWPTAAQADGNPRPAGRVAILLGLLIVAAVSVRGRIPGGRADQGDTAADSPASLVGVVTLLTASVLIMAVALAASFRKPVPDLPSGHWEPPRGSTGPRAGLRRRILLVAAGLAGAWLIGLLLATLLGGDPAELGQQPPPVSGPDSGGSTPVQPPAAPPQQPDGRITQYLQVTTVALVAMTLIGTVATALRRRRHRPRTPEGEAELLMAGVRETPEPGPEPLAVAAERGLAEVADPSRNPREAIIACYAAMEQALAESTDAAPQDSDTPSEVLARAVGNRAVRAENATTLVEVFTEARFSTHLMTEAHREVAERALRAVLDEMRQPVR